MAASMSKNAIKINAADSSLICEIEASVVTGFETVAAEEVFEKLGILAQPARGKIHFLVALRDVKKILHLSSVGNLFVVLNHFRDFQFADTVEDSLKQLESLVPILNWSTALAAWLQFRDLPATRVHRQLHPLFKNNYQADNVKAEVVSYNEESSNDIKLNELNLLDNNDKTSTSLKSSSSTQHANKSFINDDSLSFNLTEYESRNETTLQNFNGKKSQDEELSKREEFKVDLPDEIKFRATCIRTGLGHVFQSPQAAASFGGRIKDHFEWKVDLAHFDIEVILHVEEKHVYIKIALTKSSLHRRNIIVFGNATLKPTISYNMLRLCNIQPGDIVCDPMCGSGSIPIEACLNWPYAHHICGDILRKAAPKTALNVEHVNENLFHSCRGGLVIDCLRWDCCCLPLVQGSVDVFVTDLPFGRRMGSKTLNRELYPRILLELARVSRICSGRACLLTQDKQSMQLALKKTYLYWTLQRTLHILYGGLVACVYVITRTETIYEQSS